ncbi:MAG: damage-inducible protein DinB [Chloroflexi bacterium]|nr:damage-inducible protein DinB [Chloroflexota bacterium]
MDTLTTLFSHNLWANLQLLDLCAKLTDEQLDSTLDGTFGSIRDTWQHIARAEQAYFSRVSTGKLYQHPKGTDTMPIEEIRETLRFSGEGFIKRAPEVKEDETVTINWDGEPRDVPKTILLTQAINHATEHRSQIMTILTQLGIQPPDLDGWTYFDEN